MPEPMIVEHVINCARCGDTHHNMILHPFTRSHSNLSHFAMCPKLHEPILVYVKTGEEQVQEEARARN